MLAQAKTMKEYKNSSLNCVAQ
ncbi:hypothetical protein Gogos_000751 [Gossypium gossypioides]|uniref:Uncharacterized protein n=1 Tax=Gossypium gossypioides TaxID=34282 RepID=A0A7J9CU27_GOSGO|nr:hypothetical protein [Gossypium gossypioides]